MKARAYRCHQEHHKWNDPDVATLHNGLAEKLLNCLNPHCSAQRAVLFGRVHDTGVPDLGVPETFAVIHEAAADAYLADTSALPYRQALREGRSPYRRAQREHTVLTAVKWALALEFAVSLVATAQRWVPLGTGLLLLTLGAVGLFFLVVAALAQREIQLGTLAVLLSRLVPIETTKAESAAGPTPASSA